MQVRFGARRVVSVFACRALCKGFTVAQPAAGTACLWQWPCEAGGRPRYLVLVLAPTRHTLLTSTFLMQWTRRLLRPQASPRPARDVLSRRSGPVSSLAVLPLISGGTARQALGGIYFSFDSPTHIPYHKDALLVGACRHAAAALPRYLLGSVHG